MSIMTIVAGYPAHRVRSYTLLICGSHLGATSWTAFCGAAETVMARCGVFTTAGSVPLYDLCDQCFPLRIAMGYGGEHPSPTEVPPIKAAC